MTRSARIALAEFNLPSCFMVAGLDSMAVEAQVPKDRGVSDFIISTLVKER